SRRARDPRTSRGVRGRAGARLLVAGKSAALLEPDGKVPGARRVDFDLAEGNHLRIVGRAGRQQTLVSRKFGAFQTLSVSKGKGQLAPFQPEVTGAYTDLQVLDLNGDGRDDLVTAYGHVFLGGEDGQLPREPSLRLPVEPKDWSSLAVGDFNADGKPDIALLSYGMNGPPVARVYYNQGDREKPFAEKPDATIPLREPPDPKRPGGTPPLVRDAPVVADWGGDGGAGLVGGVGQSDGRL